MVSSAGSRLTVPQAVERLLQGKGQEPAFLAAHHGIAAARLMMSFERASLRQRVTMQYDPARVGGRSFRPVQADLADSAADARRRLRELARLLPEDCWSVLFDVCCLDRGLQEIEASYGWPRRGAKLVLRAALGQLALIYGFTATAQGRDSGRQRGWLEARPSMFGDPRS